MSGAAGFSLLLSEEFDTRPAARQPDLGALRAAMRLEALAELRAERAERDAEARQALATSCAALVHGISNALATLDTALTAMAHALAEAMIAAVATALPGWQARLGMGATAEIVTTLLTSLGETVSPHLAVHPDHVDEIRQYLPTDIALAPDAAVVPGALRLTWRNGRASRDPTLIWTEIETIFAAALPTVPGAEPPVSATE